MEKDSQPTALRRTDYPIIRQRLTALHPRILKLLTRTDLHVAGRHLGLLRKKTLVFDNDTESSVFFDYLTYSHRPRGFNMAELYLRIHREELDTLDRELLTCMSRALYTIVRVESLEQDGALVTDVLGKAPWHLLDSALAHSSVAGHGFAAHLLTFGDCAVQTGGVLGGVHGGLLHSDPGIEQLCNAMQRSESARTDPALRAKLARAIVAAAIRTHHTRHTRYE